MKKKSTRRMATPAERARWKKAVAEETKPEVMEANKALGRKLRKEKQQNTAAAREALAALAQLRESRGLSLADLEAATGITRGNLSRMWNNPSPNVTVETLQRIANAMDAELAITIQG